MKTYQLISVMLSCFMINQAMAIDNLELIGAYPLDGIDDMNASGLAYCNGTLLVISDNHDNDVFQVTVNDGIASVRSYRTLSDIPAPQWPDRPFLSRIKRWLSSVLTGKTYDWEGISCDQYNNLYLISEYAADVFVTGNDAESQWMNADIYNEGRKSGLFDIDNAFTEGVVIADDASRLYIAAERQPRGLMRLTFSDTGWTVDAIELDGDSVLVTPAPGRQPDFAGLSLYQGFLFTLERNASAVCQRNKDTLDAIVCWSYRDIEDSDDYGYQDARYGLGEGIVVTDDRIFIVFDHNGDARRSNPDDHRGLLLEFKVPPALLKSAGAESELMEGER